MSASSRARSLLLVAAILGSVPGAHADPTEAELAAARNLFEEALALEDRGKWAEALERVKKVAAVKTTAAVHFHLALCNEKLGHLVTAFNEFRRAEAVAATEGSPDAKRIEANSQKHAAELKARIPTLILKLPEGVQGAEAKIDGAVIDPALYGAQIPLDPGTHAIEVHADDRMPFTGDVDLAEGEAGHVVVVRMAPRPEDRTVAPTTTTSSPWPWIALGVGATSLAGAGVMYGLRASAISDLDAACAPSRSQCPDDKSDLHQRGKTYNLAGNVLLGVGIAAVGTSIALFVLAPSTPSSTTGSVSAEVIVSGGTLGLRGQF
jgi:tetratricopeptide (TPR) repeat protein